MSAAPTTLLVERKSTFRRDLLNIGLAITLQL
jgi:hypothetical protein